MPNFDENYVYSKSNISPLEWIEIIANMNMNNIRESIAILKLNYVFDKDCQYHNSFVVAKKNKNDPTFKYKFGYKIYKLLIEYDRFYEDDNAFKIKNTQLWEKLFPITSKRLIHMAQLGYNSESEYVFNHLQIASFNSMIHSTTENFNQYCKEIELLSLSRREAPIYAPIIINEYLYQEVVEKINESYAPISKYGVFGWSSFLKGMLEQEVIKIGCDKFLNIINSQKTENILLGDVSSTMQDFAIEINTFSLTTKENIVAAIKNIPTNKISLDTLYVITYLLQKEPNLRKSSQIIKHLPKLNNNEFPADMKISFSRNYVWVYIAEFTKVSEIELGINDERSEYSNNKLNGILPITYFEKGKTTQFIQQHFSILSTEDKKLAIKELVIDIFNICSNKPNQRMGINNFFIPKEWKKGIHFNRRFFLLKEFLIEPLQQQSLKNFLNYMDFDLTTMRKLSLDLVSESKDKELVNYCFNIMDAPKNIELKVATDFFIE